jgi:hypothetical protein
MRLPSHQICLVVRWLFATFFFKKCPVSLGFFLPRFFIALRHQRKSELVTTKKALFPRLSFAGGFV